MLILVALLQTAQLTSAGTGWYTGGENIGQLVEMRAYSFYEDGTTNFLWKLRNTENDGVARNGFLSWPLAISRTIEWQYSYGAVTFNTQPVNVRVTAWPKDITGELNIVELDFWPTPELYGCTTPEPNEWYDIISTCGDQWLEIRMSAQGAHTLAEVEGTMRPDNINVTPEPLSLLLLGTGLGGIVAARRKSRRKQ